MPQLDWNIFRCKFSQNTHGTFETLAYHMFCRHFGLSSGLIQRVNQTGIECDPIEKDGEWIGFQAKFYDTRLSENQRDILDSIEKAKKKYPNLSEIYLYTNQLLTESSNSQQVEPAYQREIEAKGNELGLRIVWQLSSHLAIQLEQEPDVFEYFFTQSSGVIEALRYVQEKSRRYWEGISTELSFEQQPIQLQRSVPWEAQAGLVLIYGKGGVGKSALVKAFYSQKANQNPKCSVPFFVLGADELNQSGVDEVFDRNHHLTLSKFVELHQEIEEKYFVIDSAEKVSELNKPEIFMELVRTLIQNQWRILLITRTFFMESLKERLELLEELKIQVTTHEVPSLQIQELDSLAKNYGFILPEDLRLQELLRNFFYLKQYLQFYKPEITENTTQFEDRIWKMKICRNDIQKENRHRERETLFLEMIAWKLREGRSWIPMQNAWSHAILSLLEKDEIIRYDSKMGSSTILHDIYEDWGARHWLERIWHQKGQSLSQTLEELGNSHSIRRRVREWLLWKLAVKPEGSPDILRSIIKKVTDFSDDNIWSDELLQVLLLSENTDELFLQCQELYQNDFSRFEKVLICLRTSCRGKLETSVGSRVPLGSGWNQAISFIWEHRGRWTPVQWSSILPILRIWMLHHPQGETTRYVALAVLDFYRSIDDWQNSELSYDEKEAMSSEAIQILTGSSGEIVSEFKPILEDILHTETKWIQHTWTTFCREILEKPWEHTMILKSMPLLMLEMCDKFWYIPYCGDNPFVHQDSDLFSLNTAFYWNCIPAALGQTPIWWLLHFAPLETIDFLIQFINKTIESYVTHYPKNQNFNEDIRQITFHFPDGTEKTQYISRSLWCMYRGTSSPETPYLLQSLHAALEKFLLNQAEKSPRRVEWVLDKILRETNSASMTAVVCSVVLAYPEKFYVTALVLFSTFELFRYDVERKVRESEAKAIFQMNQKMRFLLTPEQKDFLEERLESCNEKHRNLSLQDLILMFQLSAIILESEADQEVRKKIQHLLQMYRKKNMNPRDINKLDIQKYSRNHIVFPDGSIVNEIQAILTPEEQQESEILKQDINKIISLSSLQMWCNKMIRDNPPNEMPIPPYAENPRLLLQTIRQTDKDGADGGEDREISLCACTVLLLLYRDCLLKEELEYCGNLIDRHILTFKQDVNHFIPSFSPEFLLIALVLRIQSKYPHCQTEIATLLLNLYGLWDNAYITHAINAIHRVSLFFEHPEIALRIFRDFIAMGPVYERVLQEERSQNQIVRTDYSKILERFEKIYETASTSEITSEQINTLNTYHLFTAIRMIPTHITDKSFLESAAMLLQEITNRYHREDEEVEPYRRDMFFHFKRETEEWVASFLILRPTTEEMKPVLEMWLEILSENSESLKHFVSDTILAQYRFNHYDNFWFVWNRLLSVVVNNARKCLSCRVLLDYMLVTESHESEAFFLRPFDRIFYDRLIREIGNLPDVFWGITKVLNGIGKNIFFEEGITWLTDLVLQQESKIPDSVKASICYEMEKYLKEYLQRNREILKQNSEIRMQINNLLDYLRNLGSVEAQKLRDSIN